MTKKLIFILTLSLILIWSVSAFATNTPKYRMEMNRVQDLVPLSGADENSTPTAAPGRIFGQPVSVGASASPGTQVGNTYYDYQHNGSAGRQIGQNNGLVQVTWMDQDNPQISPGRLVKWNKVNVAGSPATITLDNGLSVTRVPIDPPLSADGTAFVEDQAGYTNFRVRASGKGVAFYHAVGALNGTWTAQVDQSAGFGAFSGNPAPQNPIYADTAIWPHGAVDENGGDGICHVVAIQSARSQLTDQRMYYWRGVISGGTVTWDPPVLVDSISVNSAIVEASPTNDDVAIIYTKPREIGTQVNNDVVYKYSTDGGLTGFDVGTAPTNITNYTDESPERAYTQVAALFDLNNTLHVIWPTLYNDSDGLAWEPVNLNHWNNVRGTIRTIQTADWVNSCDQVFGGFRGGTFNLQITFPALSVKPAGAGPGAGIADELLYATWVQFGPTDTDCATQEDGTTLGGQVNSELWMSVSSDDGLTWDRPQNITGTVTPDCAPGDCHGEHWMTSAAIADSAVYLSYVDDLHAGAVIRDEGEGTWANDPYMVYAPVTRLPVPEPRISVGPKTNYLELNVGTAGTNAINLVVRNLGNAPLTWNASVSSLNGGNDHILLNGQPSLSGQVIGVAGADQPLEIQFDGSGLPDPSEWDWVVEITSDDSTNNPGVGGVPIEVNLNVFVANTWYTCVADTLSTTQHRLSVSSCLEIGNSGSGGGLYTYADSSEWIFDASPVLTRMDGGTKLAYRDVLWNSISDRSRDSNRAFRAQGPISVSRTAASDIATGYAYTTDSLIRLDYEVTAFKDPGLQDGAVMKYTITNVSGVTYSGINLGAAADLDVDSSSAVNDGFVSEGNQYIGAQGGYIDTSTQLVVLQDNYAALFNIPLDSLCNDVAVGGQVLDNVDYVYEENAYNTDSLYNIIDRMAGWNGSTWQADTITDVNVVMTVDTNLTLGANDTLQMAFGFAVSDVSLGDLSSKILQLRFAVNNSCAICPIEKTGDVNTSGSITSADIIYLVGYVFKGGAAPLPCTGSGDVNCSGSVTSADIIYLVGFVFKGGNPPCDFCEQLPSPLCP